MAAVLLGKKCSKQHTDRRDRDKKGLVVLPVAHLQGKPNAWGMNLPGCGTRLASWEWTGVSGIVRLRLKLKYFLGTKARDGIRRRKGIGRR